MNKLLFFFLWAVPVHVVAQTLHDGVQFSRTEFNFYKVDNWVSRVDSIEVLNTTPKKIFLLKQHYPREFEVRFPVQGIDPGKTGIAEIIFKPSGTGIFDASISVYHSASLTPVSIHYTGEVLSLDEYATLACPSFTHPVRPPEFDIEVSVIDSINKKALENSRVEIINGESFSQLQTDNNGKAKQKGSIGYYEVYAEHTGYKGNAVDKHINPKNHTVTVALAPINKVEILLPKDTLKTIVAPTPTIAVAPVTDAPAFSLSKYKKNNIVFLIDKSSSMNGPDGMPLLKKTMTALANMMRAEDEITIITYANEAKVVLPRTAGNEHDKMIAVIEQLKCGGKTEGGKAIHMAYKTAEDNFIKGGMNQIIIATDGGFNGLSENEEELMQLVTGETKKEIKLSVLAFGQNRYGKAHIERLAKQGQGFYLFIQNEEDAAIKLTENIKLQSEIH